MIRISLFKCFSFLTAYNWKTININLIKLSRETIFRSVIDNKRTLILLLTCYDIFYAKFLSISLQSRIPSFDSRCIFAMHYRMHYRFFVKTLLDRDSINQILSLLSTRECTKFCWMHHQESSHNSDQTWHRCCLCTCLLINASTYDDEKKKRLKKRDCIMQSRKVFRERANATSRRIKVRFLIHTYVGRRASNNNSNSRDTCIAFQGYFIIAISLFFIETINSAFVVLFHSDFICAVEWFRKKGFEVEFNQRCEKSMLE